MFVECQNHTSFGNPDVVHVCWSYLKILKSSCLVLNIECRLVRKLISCDWDLTIRDLIVEILIWGHSSFTTKCEFLCKTLTSPATVMISSASLWISKSLKTKLSTLLFSLQVQQSYCMSNQTEMEFFIVDNIIEELYTQKLGILKYQWGPVAWMNLAGV